MIKMKTEINVVYKEKDSSSCLSGSVSLLIVRRAEPANFIYLRITFTKSNDHRV